MKSKAEQQIEKMCGPGNPKEWRPILDKPGYEARLWGGNINLRPSPGQGTIASPEGGEVVGET
jgi:hypothetical protein